MKSIVGGRSFESHSCGGGRAQLLVMADRKGCELSNEDQRAEKKNTNVDNLARLGCSAL
jgi:hypothetical protein